MDYSVYTIDIVGLFKQSLEVYRTDQLVYTCTNESFWNRRRKFIYDATGAEVLQWKRSLKLTQSEYMLYKDDELIGVVRKGHLSKRLEADVYGDLIAVSGNFFGTAFTFERAGEEVAKVSRKLLKRKRSYGIAIAPGENVEIYLTILTIIIDVIRRQSNG